ncbi:MAG: cell division protein FtsL [Termitinemataceae bacterium]
MLKRVLLYVWVLTIPLFFALNAWQASRCYRVTEEIRRLEKIQEDRIEENKRLIAGIAVLSSTDRIERIAKDVLKLQRKKPEEIIQIHIARINTDG